MKLSKLLESVSTVEYNAVTDLEISSVTDDSRECVQGSLFVALVGHIYNGQDYIQDAYKNGARAFVLSKKTELPDDAVLIYTNNPRKSLAELCASFYGHPEKRLVCVGVTGTKGKTTTTVFLSEILAGLGVKNIVIGTLGTRGINFENEKKASNTTPPPTLLFSMLSKACDEGVSVAVIEISSQALKDFRAFSIPFKFVAFCGLSRDHIGESEHPTASDYVHAKRMLFSEYGARVAVVNCDDPYSSYMSCGISRVVRCGFSDNADFKINSFSDSPNGSEFCIGSVCVASAMPGAYNALNICLALALAVEITGKRLNEAVKAVSGVKVDGRFERMVIDGKNIVVDYAHNTDSFKEITSLARRLFGGRIICVFGSVGERSYDRRRELAVAAEKYADMSVITTDNPGFEFPLSICADIYSVFSDKTKAKIIVERGEAITYAVKEADVGDCVLILGKGHEKEINISGRRISFSDSEFVRQMQRHCGASTI